MLAVCTPRTDRAPKRFADETSKQLLYREERSTKTRLQLQLLSHTQSLKQPSVMIHRWGRGVEEVGTCETTTTAACSPHYTYSLTADPEANCGGVGCLLSFDELHFLHAQFAIDCSLCRAAQARVPQRPWIQMYRCMTAAVRIMQAGLGP